MNDNPMIPIKTFDIDSFLLSISDLTLIKRDWEVNKVNLVFSAERACISSQTGMNFHHMI
jgi:hypothetical protein